jgi:rhamnosyltransferase subunit B
MARIVLNTFGSFGDVHPYLAIGIELKRRGHDPVIATSEVYRAKIETEGIAFAAVRPDVGELLGDKDTIRQIWDPVKGPEALIRGYLMPAVEQSYQDLFTACAGADLLLTHAAAYAGPVVAEKLGLRWLSVALQPLVFFSAYDKPTVAGVPGIRFLNMLGAVFTRALLSFGRRRTSSWAGPLHELRKRVGLSPLTENPLMGGQFSPFGTVAMFSKYFAQPQPDWPVGTQVTGFPFFDRSGEEGAALARFLDAGPAPLLFTLGSSAVMEPGSFYRESFEAAQRLGMRAVLLVGLMSRDAFPQPQPDSIHIASYAPYSELMPRCAASVHQGGIGTTAQALRSGRPMVVVPWSHDQPDNAERVRRLGVARTIPRSGYTAGRAAREIDRLLSMPRYAERARELGERISQENGIIAACDAIESQYSREPPD